MMLLVNYLLIRPSSSLLRILIPSKRGPLLIIPLH
jgi:hypothetical protein